MPMMSSSGLVMPPIGTLLGKLNPIGFGRSWVQVIWSSNMSGAGMLLDPGAWPNAGPAAKAPNPSAPKAVA